MMMATFSQRLPGPAVLFGLIGIPLLCVAVFAMIVVADSALDIPMHDTPSAISTTGTLRWTIAFLAIGLLYWSMFRFFGKPLRRELGQLHFMLTLLGLLMMMAPIVDPIILMLKPGAMQECMASRHVPVVAPWTILGEVVLILGQCVFLFNLIRTLMRPKAV
ncbi:MAG: hypothetical protein QM724_08375 [Flavobacteriales bacterium]